MHVRRRATYKEPAAKRTDHSESVTILSTHPPRDTFAYAHACKAMVVPSTLVRHPLEETAPWTGMDPGAVVGTDFKGRAALEIEAKEEWV